MVTILEPIGPLSEKALRAAEAELGITLPETYRRFMLQYNGGRPKPDGFDIIWHPQQPCAEDWRTSSVSWLLSIYDEDEANFLTYNTRTYAGRIPKGTIAIAHDPGGNLILLAVTGPHNGKVLFWVKDQEVEEGEVPAFDNVGVVASSFDDFLTEKLR